MVLLLNERQKKALEHIKLSGRINRESYCRINNVKKSVAYEELKNMVNENIIKQVGKGKATYYIIFTGRLPDDYRTKENDSKRIEGNG